MDFASTFKSDYPSRDKFLSRLFGIFSEEIVRIWCRSPMSPYEDLGRPAVREVEGGEGKPSILDFTLRDRDTSLTYVAEMKCELEYNGYKYLLLESEDQLTHHNKPAFARFLGVARNPSAYQVKTKGKPVEISGSILIWGSVSGLGRRKVREATGIKDVISLEDIIADLVAGANQEYLDFVDERMKWSGSLFEQLKTGSG